MNVKLDVGKMEKELNGMNNKYIFFDKVFFLIMC